MLTALKISDFEQRNFAVLATRVFA